MSIKKTKNEIKIQPNLFIVGSARSGTTSLCEFLKEHSVCFGLVKEPKFLSSLAQTYPHTGPGDETVDHSVLLTDEQYHANFKDCNREGWVCDGSSDSLYFGATVAQEIYERFGDVKIVISLRNPIDRAWSAYSNLVRDSRETLQFRQALEVEESRIDANFDWMWHYKRGGLYYENVRGFLERFSDVHVIIFEELIDDPKNILNELLAFLNLSTDASAGDLRQFSLSGEPKNFVFRFFLSRTNFFALALRRLMMRLIPRWILEICLSRLLQKSRPSEGEVDYLKDFFSEDVRSTRRLLARDIKLWHQFESD